MDRKLTAKKYRAIAVRKYRQRYSWAPWCVALVLCASWAFAQVPSQPFRNAASTALEVCHIATPAPSTGAAVAYGFHATNTSGSTVYVQLFNLSASPSASATPLGSGSWVVPAASDRDVSIGEVQGLSFNVGIEVCCSTNQWNYQAATAVCGFVVEYQ